MTGGLEINREAAGDAVVVRVAGEVDMANAAFLADALRAAAAENAGVVIADLAGVGYLDSAGIKVLFEIARGAELARQRLVLVVPDGSPLRRLFAITRVDEVAEIVRSERDATTRPSPA